MRSARGLRCQQYCAPCAQNSATTIAQKTAFNCRIGKTYRYTIESYYAQEDQYGGVPGIGGVALQDSLFFERRRRGGAAGWIGAAAVFNAAGNTGAVARYAAKNPDIGRAAVAETSQRGGAGGPIGAARSGAQGAQQRRSAASAGFIVAARRKVIRESGAAKNRRIASQRQRAGKGNRRLAA